MTGTDERGPWVRVGGGMGAMGIGEGEEGGEVGEKAREGEEEVERGGVGGWRV